MTTLSKSTVAALLIVATAVPGSWAHHHPIRGYGDYNCVGIVNEYATPDDAKGAGSKSYSDLDNGGGCINFCP